MASTPMIECPKCLLEWEPPCEQTNCIEIFGECVSCHFLPKGIYNKHGTGEGTAEQLFQIAMPQLPTLDDAYGILDRMRSLTSE